MCNPEMMPIKNPIPAAAIRADRLVSEYLEHSTPKIMGIIIVLTPVILLLRV